MDRVMTGRMNWEYTRRFGCGTAKGLVKAMKATVVAVGVDGDV